MGSRMRRSATLFGLLLLTGCSDDIAGYDCSDVAEEAIGISDGALVSLYKRSLTSRTDDRIVCHGIGLYSGGDELPVRFEAYRDDDGEILIRYDVAE